MFFDPFGLPGRRVGTGGFRPLSETGFRFVVTRMLFDLDPFGLPRGLPLTPRLNVPLAFLFPAALLLALVVAPSSCFLVTPCHV